MSSSRSTQWILREATSKQLERLSNDPTFESYPYVIQQLLAHLDLSEDQLRHHLHPKLADLSDPFQLPEMKQGAQRILKAIDENETICLYGDYDVDGVTSLSILHEMLCAYGATVSCFLPHRMDEGYGLSLEGLNRCMEENGKPGLLIAMDCGTSSVKEVSWLAQQGVDCVIIDHHEPGAELPPSVALINPKIQGEQTYFCTAGLAFKVSHALQKLRKLPNFDLKDLLDLVALGTVADLVPLLEENRILVKRGLQQMLNTPRTGLISLKRVASVEGLIQTHHIGFRLAPRLNAAGRLDTARTALDLLLCEDPIQAEEAASLLDLHNRQRQEVEQLVQEEAQQMLQAHPEWAEAPCIILGSKNWHQGVVGIVASRLMREYHRPTILIAFDSYGNGKGSGRSVKGISLVHSIQECRPFIEKGGGHAMAAGVSVHEEQFESFRKAMIASIQAQIKGDELTPKLELDAEVELVDLSPRTLDHYLALEPFGMGNPEPLFLVRQVQPQLPGSVLKEKHWKLSLSDGTATKPFMWFNAPWENPPQAPWDVAFKVQRQIFRGQESWQFIISEVRSAE